MAAPPQPPSSQPSKSRPKSKRIQKEGKSKSLNSLPWSSAFPTDDPISLVVGSNELEGGFFSLEEIDEADYGFELPKPEGGNKQLKSLKQKHSNVDGSDGSEGEECSDGVEGEVEGETQLETKNKGKKKKKKKNKKEKELTGNVNEGVTDGVELQSEGEQDEGDKLKKKKRKKENKDSAVEDMEGEVKEDNPVDEFEYLAWSELRLHPLLMKSIYRLCFKEPTPIQKACIPAAAHQGKDVVGAAETGSGKTLAFGLPILQRLLDEREKASNKLEQKGEEAEKYAPDSLLRALIITPTRELALQVTDHLKAVAQGTNIWVVPIVGGISTEKQERLLRKRPQIVVGTPGRLWEYMSKGEKHLVELQTLSFFVLDEADRMIQHGHFHELQSIIDMLPMSNGSTLEDSQSTENCVTVQSFQKKKRQTLVFSATLGLSSDFHKKLKRGSMKPKQQGTDSINSIETLSERAGMRANAAIIDLTNASILANKLEESFIECKEEEKDAHLYYILTVHGQGRTIVFCTSIAALRHISALLRTLGVSILTLHAEMEQRARLKARDRFNGSENGILVATDVAARGLDFASVRTVIHYQLPHSAGDYVHRSGRTARASADGCSIALISPKETSKFASLCKSFSKESVQHFPLDSSYMPEVVKRLSLARQIDKITRKDSQDKVEKSWLERNAKAVELDIGSDESDDEKANNFRKKKVSSLKLNKLQQELNKMLSHPLQPKTFSHRYLAGAGVSPILQLQLEEMAKRKVEEGRKNTGREDKRRKLVVIGQNCIEPLQALKNVGYQVPASVNKDTTEKRRNVENLRRKRKKEKIRLRDQRRKQRKRN